MRRTFFFFLKPSYWSRRRKQCVELTSVYQAEANGGPVLGDSVEPVSPEFRGKEVIRCDADLTLSLLPAIPPLG